MGVENVSQKGCLTRKGWEKNKGKGDDHQRNLEGTLLLIFCNYVKNLKIQQVLSTTSRVYILLIA